PISLVETIIINHSPFGHFDLHNRFQIGELIFCCYIAQYWEVNS
ncbi:MAG: hypothetical protein ACI956_002707, partial [Nonlabens sp.]